MRFASYETQAIHGSNGEFVGVALGHDFCAEHEVGIARLQRRLGVLGRAERAWSAGQE